MEVDILKIYECVYLKKNEIRISYSKINKFVLLYGDFDFYQTIKEILEKILKITRKFAIYTSDGIYLHHWKFKMPIFQLSLNDVFYM